MENNSKILLLNESSDFKQQNKSQWIANSSFWLSGKMNHINDVAPITIDIIKKIIEQEKIKAPSIFDIGCGEGWLYRNILKSKIDCSYYGTDFNEIFVEELSKEFADCKQANFIYNDIELEVPISENSADIIVNAFNFFELPDLEKGFSNTVKLLKKNGVLIIITIDPIIQLLAVSDNYFEFLAYLKLYAEGKSKVGYKKNIVVGDERSDRYYMGILYSLIDFLNLAKVENLDLVNCKEIVKSESPTPQVFQFLIFKKK